MKYGRFIILLAMASSLFTGCEEDIEPITPPDPGTEQEKPIENEDTPKRYKSIKEYALEYTPNMQIGIGLGADIYVRDQKYKSTVDENFQIYTTGNAMKHSSVVTSSGALNFSLIDSFLAKIPSDVDVYGHNFLWHTQQKQDYLMSLIAPERKVAEPQEIDFDNVVTNSGFEDGTDGWTGFWGHYTYDIVQPGYESDNAIHFTIGSECVNQWDAQLFWQLEEYLVPGETYYYEFYAKSDCGLQCQFLAQNAEYSGIYKDTFTPGTDWTFCSGSFTLGESELADIERAGVQFGGEPGSQIWFDDFKFGKVNGSEGGDQLRDLIGTDGQFEWTDGTTGQWTGFWSKYTYQLVSPGYESDQAMEFTLTADCVNMWDAQLFYPVNLEVGKSYAYSFRAKSDSGLSAQFISQNDAYDGIYKTTWELTDEWTLCEGEFTYNMSDPADLCRVGVQFGRAESEGAKLWIDDFKFYEKVERSSSASVHNSSQKSGSSYIYIYKTAEEKKAILLEAMESWIRQMAEHMGDRVVAWDVINEPIADGYNAWRGINNVFDGKDKAPVEHNGLTLNWASDHWYWAYFIGKEYAVKAFEYARKYCAPDAKLYVNDYNLEISPGKLDALIDFAEYIDESNSTGGPLVDGIGTQMHVQASITKDKVDAMFKTMAATGKLVRVTELDVAIGTDNPSEAQLLAQAETYKMIVESYKENVPEAQQSGITLWTLSDNPAEHLYWLKGDSPNLFDSNYERKLAYKYFCDGLAGFNISEENGGLNWKSPEL